MAKKSTDKPDEAGVPRLADLLQSVNESLPIHVIGKQLADAITAAPEGSKEKRELLQQYGRLLLQHEIKHPDLNDEEIPLLSDEQLESMILSLQRKHAPASA